jgi:hypothetical protein
LLCGAEKLYEKKSTESVGKLKLIVSLAGGKFFALLIVSIET